MKIKKTILPLLLCALFQFSFMPRANAVMSSFHFFADIVDANGQNPGSCFNICTGQQIHIKNISRYLLGTCNGTGVPIAQPLTGTISIWYYNNNNQTQYLVGSMSVGSWGYGQVLNVTLNGTLSGTVTGCASNMRNVYIKYYGSDVSTLYCGDAPGDDQRQTMVYGKINPLPVANAGSDVSICSGQSTTLTASGGSTYVWNGGSLVNASGASQVVSPTVTTSYTVTVTNSNGCSSSDVVTVTVNPLPTNNLQNYTLCPGDAWPVLDAGAGYASYVWYFNGSGIGIGQTMPTAGYGYGTYSVTITSASGCTATYSSVVSLSSSANLDATFTLSIQTYSNNTAVITATANAFSGNNTWELHNSNSNCYEQFIPAQSYTYSGIFNGHTQTYAAVATGNWYVIKHIASSRPCNIPATSTTCIYIGNNQRILFEQTDGVVVSNNQLVTNFYPNPSDGKINLEISGTQEGQSTTVEIVDMQGRVVSNTEYESVNGPVSIDLTNEAKGIYLVRVINGESISTEKIVIE